jgi:subtilisin
MTDAGLSRREVLGAGASGIGALTFGTGGAGAADAGEYNVGTTSPAAERAARDAADRVHRVLDWDGGKKTITLTLPEQAARNLRKRSGVRYVEENGLMHAVSIDADDSEVPWGIDRVDAEKAHDGGETGGDNTDGEGGADIAIIDTGIDDDHPDLADNLATPLGDTTNHKAFVDCRGSNCNYPWSDDDDHGTHCAGVADALDNGEGVVGVSTEATLHAVKVLDNRGSGSFSDVAAGIEWVADQGYDVGSMSLGASSGSQTVKDACEYAYGKGVLLVGAAGNSGPCSDCVGYPAAYSEVIAVSATNKEDNLADYSSTGPEVELAAPGSNIYSTVIGGYDTFSGTSMACPHVSGAGGQLMDNDYTNTEAREQLNSTAEDIGLGSNEQGNGLLDVEAALGGSSDTNSAPTVDNLSLSEVETSDSDAEFDADWSVSDSDRNLSSVDFVLTQDSDGSTEDSTTVSVSGSEASGTTRLVAAGDDGSGNSYTVELTVADGDGATASDTASATESESTSSAPTIDTFELTNDSNPAWTRYYVDWAVSDADGDLSSVTSELLDSSGKTLDTDSSSVSGSSASGTHYVESKGSASEIVLTVTDAAGNSTSTSEPI